MSKFILNMPVLARLSRVCDAGKIIRLEYTRNHLYGISSDETIACVEFLGESAHPDEKCDLILTEELQNDDVVLVKASHGTGLDCIIQALKGK